MARSSELRTGPTPPRVMQQRHRHRPLNRRANKRNPFWKPAAHHHRARAPFLRTNNGNTNAMRYGLDQCAPEIVKAGYNRSCFGSRSRAGREWSGCERDRGDMGARFETVRLIRSAACAPYGISIGRLLSTPWRQMVSAAFTGGRSIRARPVGATWQGPFAKRL